MKRNKTGILYLLIISILLLALMIAPGCQKSAKPSEDLDGKPKSSQESITQSSWETSTENKSDKDDPDKNDLDKNDPNEDNADENDPDEDDDDDDDDDDEDDDDDDAADDDFEEASGEDELDEDAIVDIVLGRIPGASREDIIRLDYDVEDGVPVYSGTAKKDKLYYKFEIDARTGTILDWEVDR